MKSLLASFVMVALLPVGVCAADDVGTGLTADYYNNADFTSLVLSRTDATVNFDWGGGVPASGVAADTFSIVWSGQIEPEFSETYTFYLTADDGVRLWVDDRLVVARTFWDAATPELRAQVALKAGQRVNVRVEYFEQSGNAKAKLEWSSTSRTREVIPQGRLFPARVERAGGSLLCESWTGVSGTAISGLTGLANYPKRPAAREFLTAFECLSQNWGDSYGSRVTGYIVAPASGDFTFAVAGDDSVELWLSTDANPANKQLVTSLASYTAFRAWGTPSDAVPLVRGRRYYVEMLHKEGAGNDHWSVGWKKPGDADFSVIPGSALVPPGTETAQPAQANLMDTLATGHPRLFATAARFQKLKNEVTNNPTGKAAVWYAAVKNAADADLNIATGTSTALIRDLALAYRISGNTAYAERAWTELNNIAARSSWNTSGYYDLGAADQTYGMSIGYDWLYDYWTQARRDTIRNAIINKGLNSGLSAYTGNEWWTQSTSNNWNVVCNGNLIVGALAVGTESESLTENILNRALNSVRPIMQHFTADGGGWYEGSDYWYYMTLNAAPMLTSLEWALGSDFGLGATRHLSETGFYAMYASSPRGGSFNFSDGGSYTIRGPIMAWSARRHGRPIYSWWEHNNGGGAIDALWYEAPVTDAVSSGLATDAYFHGPANTSYPSAEVVTMREQWSQSRASFVGCKGGEMGMSHGQLDAGSFVFDANGKRWAHDMGQDDYTLSGYFGANRWTYYRNRAEGNNTILFNPGSGTDQKVDSHAPCISQQNAAGVSQTIFDLTPVSYGVTKAWRGFQLLNNRRQLLIQDEVTASTAATAWWFMHVNTAATTVAIATDGKSVTLTQGTERLWLKLVSGAGVFTLRAATPLPSSPNPGGQNANTDFKKLSIQLTGVTNTTLAVWMVPLATGESLPTTLPPIVPLANWSTATEFPNVVVTTSGGSLNEATVTGGTFTFTRSGSTTAALTVGYAMGGTATSGSDYAALSGSVTIPAGQSSATVSLVPLDDTEGEGTETVALSLKPGPYVMATTDAQVIQILDDDVFSVAVNDTFDLGAATAGDDSGDPSDVAWTGSGGTVSVVADATINTGKALHFDATGGFATITGAFTQRSLVAAGDSLKLSFDYRYTEAPGSNSGGFRFGLFNDVGDGYFSQQGTGSGNNLHYLTEDTGGDGGYGAGSTTSGLASGSKTTVNDQLKHSVTMTLKKTATGVSVTTVCDGSTLSANDATPVTTFGKIVVRNGSITSDFNVDNVRLEYSRNLAPVFVSDPLVKAAAPNGVAYAGSLAADAVDPNPADTLMFSKVSGPAWLTVGSGGALSGTPGILDLGVGSFVVRATDPGGLAVEVAMEIEVTGTPYDAWRRQQFGANAGNDALAGDQADPDHDGLVNLIEYALGIDPNVAGVLPVVLGEVTVDDVRYLTLSVALNPEAADVSVTVEASDDLTAGSWSTENTVIESDSGLMLVVRDALPIGNSTARFLRVRVVRE